jgi:integrase/recombinase XerD
MPVSSVERPVSALRQRMLEDMAMRGLRSDTQRDYVRVVRSFAAFLGQPPDTATAEDIRRFQVHQRESGVQPSSAASCSMSCHAAFTVSAITACSPVQHARLVLPAPASCLPSRRRRSLWNHQSHSIISRPVPAAAGA